MFRGNPARAGGYRRTREVISAERTATVQTAIGTICSAKGLGFHAVAVIRIFPWLFDLQKAAFDRLKNDESADCPDAVAQARGRQCGRHV